MVCNNDIMMESGTCRYISRYPLRCPECGDQLSVHGTYKRKVAHSYSESECTFRVMLCLSCQRTHREIPAWVIPYKRYSVEQYCYYLEIAEDDQKQGRPLCIPESYRALHMKSGFEQLKEDMTANGLIFNEKSHASESYQEEIEHLIFQAVNNSSWKQHLFV